MSLKAKSIDLFAATLERSLQDQIPALGTRGTMITKELINQVKEIIRQNQILLLVLAGSALTMAAGFPTLLPTLIAITVNILGFTTGGVLKGKYLRIYMQVSLIFRDILLGSIAALIQSVVYGGETSGWFSVLQGIGATASISPPVVIGIGGTLAVGGIYFLSPRQEDVKFSTEFLMTMELM
jgi:hypothetical protein